VQILGAAQVEFLRDSRALTPNPVSRALEGAIVNLFHERDSSQRFFRQEFHRCTILLVLTNGFRARTFGSLRTANHSSIALEAARRMCPRFGLLP
jgi:hypothetical protein